MSNENGLEEIKRGQTVVPVESLLLERWSPRAFASTPVSDDSLKQIFAAASWAASSYNEQPWRFILGRKGDETWEKLFQTLMPFNQSWARFAPVLYAGLAKKTFSLDQKPNAVAVHDLGAASANASLQATALGLHTHGMRGFDQSKLIEAFAVPEDFEPVACWALGYLGDPESLPENFKAMERQPRVRKTLEEIVFKDWNDPAF